MLVLENALRGNRCNFIMTKTSDDFLLRQDWSWNRPALDYIEIYWFASSR